MKVVIFGASGMVGQGALLECLDDPTVTSVLVVGRSPCGIEHAKFEEIIHSDFTDYGPVEKEQLRSIRRKVARTMVTSMVLIPHVAHMDEADDPAFQVGDGLAASIGAHDPWRQRRACKRREDRPAAEEQDQHRRRRIAETAWPPGEGL